MSNVDDMGRTIKVGVDVHARACAHGHCFCGLDERVDDHIADRNNPFTPYRNPKADR